MASKPQELRDRTKAFALRVMRLFRALPYRTETQVWGSNCCVVERQWQQIIERFVEHDQRLNSLLESGS